MSFSLPEATWPELVDAAARYGYGGLEPRVGGNHGHGVEIDTTAGQRKEIRDIAASQGVEVACVATSCQFADPAKAAETAQLAHDAITLANDLGSTRLRVFGGKFPDTMSREDATEQVATSLSSIADEAAAAGVILCLETHDAWTTPSHVAEVMRRVNHPAIAVNWDVMHPPRTGGSTLEGAYDELRQWVQHTHIHDSTTRPDKLDFTPMGEGDMDHRVVLSLLQQDGYDGWLSGEWIGWEPGDVHLPREIAVLKQYEAELAS